MKHLSSTSLLISTFVLLCGCGGGRMSGPPLPSPNIAGNWQFRTTSIASINPSTIAGSIHQSESSVSGAVHIEGSNCFDQLSTMGLTGTLTGSNILLTSTSIGGQVTTLTGNISDTALTGTYTIKGGCADGDQGNVTGIKIPLITGNMGGSFTTSDKEIFDVVTEMTQGTASSAGSYAITGTITFSMPCLTSGTIKSGTFPSGSFILGTSVALEIETDNGTLTFRGTADPVSGEIRGTYTVFGGTCDQSGTAVLQASNPWDY